eukprot:EG_transcript_27233
MADGCCPTDKQGVPAPYIPTGSLVSIAGADVYEVGSGPKVIIYVYDIFGMTATQHHKFCDTLAAAGFLVLMPDFLKDTACPLSNWPPKEGIPAFRESVARVEKTCPALVQETVRYAKAKGGIIFGAYGACWGLKVAAGAAVAGLAQAVATAHPSALTADLAEAANVPFCVLPSKDEAPMEDVQVVLAAKPFAALNVWQRFDDMHHGWTGARQDPADPRQVQRAEEAYAIV